MTYRSRPWWETNNPWNDSEYTDTDTVHIRVDTNWYIFWVPCKNCGTTISSIYRFCPWCGAEQHAKRFCPTCGQEIKEKKE